MMVGSDDTAARGTPAAGRIGGELNTNGGEQIP
jgi:hypothetical protein